MNLRIILPLATLAVSTLFFAGCSDDGRLTEVNYNNEVVDDLNRTSNSLEETTVVYDASVPNIVTEDAEIDTPAMQSAFDIADTDLVNAESVLLLQSRDEEQQANVTVEFQNYLELGRAYLDVYEEMIEYYASGSFANELNKVAEYDKELHTTYNALIESNNALVDILECELEDCVGMASE